MYTSFGKANDRFGFEMRGSFRCAYAKDRIVVAVSLAVIGLWIVLIIINVITYAYQMTHMGAAVSQALNDVIYHGTGEQDPKITTWGAAIEAGFTMITTWLGLVFLAIFITAFIIILKVLHTGRKYSFSADEQKFVVTYPPKMNRKDEIIYDDVLGFKWEERKSVFAPKCFDIEITARDKVYEYRVVLTKIARVNGITETPFNIVRERAGFAEKDVRYMINRGITNFR